MANTYDDAVKALSTVDLTPLCRWLGLSVVDGARPLRLAESAPAMTTRAVDLLVAVGVSVALHLEFQTWPDKEFAYRNLDYRLRLRLVPELAGKELVQHAILLGEGTLDGGVRERRLRYSYEVHELREEDPEQFLVDPSLAPFAVLARMPRRSRPEMFARALGLIAEVDDATQRQTLLRVAVDLAGIRLDRVTIKSIWKEYDVPIPSLLNQVYEEALAEGVEQGVEQGIEQGIEQVTATILRHRFGLDERIPALAHRLAALGADRYLDLIDQAATLDDLAGQQLG